METKGPANNGARRRKNIVLEGCWTGVGRKVLRMLRGEKQQQQVYREIEIVREEGELVNRHFFSDIYFYDTFLERKKKNIPRHSGGVQGPQPNLCRPPAATSTKCSYNNKDRILLSWRGETVPPISRLRLARALDL